MADGPAIYPQSYYGTSPLDKFVTGAVEGYGKAIDFQAKSDALSMQLLSNAKLREAQKERAGKSSDASDSAGYTDQYYGGGVDAGTAAGGVGVGPTLQEGTGGKENWETVHNNFAGMRKTTGPARGPNAGGFQEFQTPEQGVQAIHNQLERYISGATTGQPLTTIRQIVSTWAPPKENPTEALIANASQIMGVDSNTPLNWSDPTVKAKMVETMIRNEQGGHLHPNAAAAIPKVFGAANWQPYSRAQQAAIGPNPGAPPIPAAPSAAAAPSGGGGAAPSAGASLSAPGAPYALVPYYDPNTLMPGARPAAALSRTMPAGTPGAQTYAAPPQPPPVDYAALVQPQYALAPPSSGLFG